MLRQILQGKDYNLFFWEKAKSSYPKVLTNNHTEEVNKCLFNGGYSYYLVLK